VEKVQRQKGTWPQLTGNLEKRCKRLKSTALELAHEEPCGSSKGLQVLFYDLSVKRFDDWKVHCLIDFGKRTF
jgi:hypothetical protein